MYFLWSALLKYVCMHLYTSYNWSPPLWRPFAPTWLAMACSWQSMASYIVVMACHGMPCLLYRTYRMYDK